MASNAIPIPVHDTPVRFELRTNNARLCDVLTKLSNTVARNGKALMQLQEEVKELRGVVEKNEQTTKRMFDRADELRLQVQDDLVKATQRITGLEQTVVYHTQLQNDMTQVWGAIGYTRKFIDEMEQGKGERVSRFVTQYIEAFVPKWYSGVSNEMWSRFVAALAKNNEEVAEKIDARGNLAEERAKDQLLNSNAEISNMVIHMNNDRKEDARLIKSHLEDQMQRLHTQVETQLAVMRADAAEQRSAFVARCERIEESADALRATLFLEDDLCKELVSTAKRSLGASSPTSNVSSVGNMSLQQQHQHLHHHKEASLFSVPLDKAPSDPRVQRVAQTPHFSVLRASLQKELADRLEFMKVDLHQCFVQELVDVQRELKGKVGASKFAELLAQYRDHQLYTQVKGLLSETAELRNMKVDSALFFDALKSKADAKTLEKLVDRTALSSVVGSVSNRVEELEHAMIKLQDKQENLHVTNLRIQAALERPTMNANLFGAHGSSANLTALARQSSSVSDILKKRPARITTQTHTNIFGEDDGSSGIRSAAEVMDDRVKKPQIPDAVIISDPRAVPPTHQQKRGLHPDGAISETKHQPASDTAVADGDGHSPGSSTSTAAPAPSGTGVTVAQPTPPRRTGAAPWGARPSSSSTSAITGISATRQRTGSASASAGSTPRGTSSSVASPPQLQPMEVHGLIPLTGAQAAYCIALDVSPATVAGPGAAAKTSHRHAKSARIAGSSREDEAADAPQQPPPKGFSQALADRELAQMMANVNSTSSKRRVQVISDADNKPPSAPSLPKVNPAPVSSAAASGAGSAPQRRSVGGNIEAW